MHLNQSELLVAFILQDFSEQSHFMVFFQISFYTVDNRCCPLHNQRLQPILLIQVSIHVLLHCFLRRSTFFALLIKFHFLSIHILNCVLQLLKCQYSCLSSQKATSPLLRLLLLRLSSLRSISSLSWGEATISAFLLLLKLVFEFPNLSLLGLTFLILLSLTNLRFIQHRL